MHTKLKAADFDYALPDKFIAQAPAKKRDAARLLVLDRRSGRFFHHRFFEIEKFLHAGDLLVLNDTKVVPARLVGRKADGSAKIDVLLLAEIKKNVWQCLVRPGKRLKIGGRVIFAKGQLWATVLAKKDDGSQFLQFESRTAFREALEKWGKIPLPPYIQTAGPVSSKSYLGRRYQTIFASCAGASAAPTAGLHFTPALLRRLKKKGVKVAFLTLHTGLGTFRPVYAEYVHDHKMHAEFFEIGKECIDAIKSCRKGKVVAVGTTVVRALESLAQQAGVKGRRQLDKLKPSCGETNLFIYPGFKFKLVDAMITNFHFPRSTLLMLVSAFVGEGGEFNVSRQAGIPTHYINIESGQSSMFKVRKGREPIRLAGRDLLLEAYEEAKRRKYRFFSFGDAMLIE